MDAYYVTFKHKHDSIRYTAAIFNEFIAAVRQMLDAFETKWGEKHPQHDLLKTFGVPILYVEHIVKAEEVGTYVQGIESLEAMIIEFLDRKALLANYYIRNYDTFMYHYGILKGMFVTPFLENLPLSIHKQ